MKSLRILMTVVIAFLFIAKSNGQTADEVVNKYLNAIGGKENIGQLKSFYTEGKMAVMGMEASTKVTILNGVGMKQETEMMSNTSVSALSEKGGWAINPQSGNPGAVDMPADQFNSMKGQMVLGAPFINYQANGMKVELGENETVDGVNAIKVILTKADNSTSTYFFDPLTYLIIRSDQKMKMRGQEVETMISYLDYKEAGKGYLIPFKTEIKMGETFKMVTTITKAEVNVAVDPVIFNKP